jgi:hypothetical protein
MNEKEKIIKDSLEKIEIPESLLPENIEKKRAIVRTHIDHIEVSDWQTITTAQIQAADIFSQRVQKKEKRYTLITIYDVYGYKYQYRYFPRWSFGKSRLEQLTEGVWAECKIAA